MICGKMFMIAKTILKQAVMILLFFPSQEGPFVYLKWKYLLLPFECDKFTSFSEWEGKSRSKGNMPIITCYVMVAFTENQVAFPLFFSNLPCILWALKPMKKDDIFKTLTPTAKNRICMLHPSCLSSSHFLFGNLCWPALAARSFCVCSVLGVSKVWV